MSSVHRLLTLGLPLLLTACSLNTEFFLPDKSVEYKKERQADRQLEIPPDLTTNSSLAGSEFDGSGHSGATYSEFAAAQAAPTGTRQTGGRVLPEPEGVEMMRDGDLRWLVVDADAQTVWDNILEFWQESGVLLQEQDPVVGVMRTGWLENRARLKRDLLTDTLRKVFDALYETGFRDQYRVRLERGQQPGITEIYLTHYAMEERLTEATTGETDRTVWVPSERNPELELIMLRQIMLHLGVEQQIATTKEGRPLENRPRSRLQETDTHIQLTIDEDVRQAWRLVGIALDRVGFAVEDRDRTQQVYFVRYFNLEADAEDDGFWSSLAFWEDDEVDTEQVYRVKLQAAAESSTEVTVRNQQDQILNSPTARRILKLMHEQLR